MPREGIEPSLPCEKRILSPSRLPIPPPRHVDILLHLIVIGKVANYSDFPMDVTFNPFDTLINSSIKVLISEGLKYP